MEVEIGDTVSYVCVGYGKDVSTNILWKFGDTVLTNNSFVGIYENLIMVNNQTFTLSTLELCSIELEASGMYSCTANNSVDSESFTFTLNVVVHNNFIIVFAVYD